MRLARLSITNFRNFEAVNVALHGNVVLLGENRVGKSNLLFAIRLVLDPTLPDSSRQLKVSDFWDGCDLSKDPQIKIDLDFAEFENEDAQCALLTDFRLAEEPAVARLSFVFRKKHEVEGPIKSGADCEFIVCGGDDETRSVPSKLRRRIALDMLDALRDAEGELGTWRRSPLRPLLEDAISTVDHASLASVAADLDKATKALEAFPSIKALEDGLREGILNLAGKTHDIDARLRFAPTDTLRLFRSIAMFIDNGKRGIAEASLGSANVALIALKLAEFAWRRAKNERNYSLLSIEEPEAHLHPQLQRGVFSKLFSSNDETQAIIVTSHSPTLAAAAPLRAIVSLRSHNGKTDAYSLAELPVTSDELEDLERYLTATRSEILFSRGVIFVEGDAEEALLPSFAGALGYDLDQLGISVCNVGGVNFLPYIKLASSLGLPFSVVTDWDPLDGSRAPLGKLRALNIWAAHASLQGDVLLSDKERDQLASADLQTFRERLSEVGVFLNEQTFEVSIAQTHGLMDALLDILSQQNFGSRRTKRINSWREGAPVDPTQLLAMVADIGKGRLSSKLVKRISASHGTPEYIAAAIKFVSDRV